MKTHVKKKTGVTMDAADLTGKGGNTNKGDVRQRMMVNHRDVRVETIDSRFQ